MKKRLYLTTHTMIERIIYITKKIGDGTYPNATHFAKKLEVSTSTINRDIEFIRCRLNVPICYDSHRKGYFYNKDFTYQRIGSIF